MKWLKGNNLARLPHRVVATRRGVEKAVVTQFDPSETRQPVAQVGVFAMEFDRGIESADALEPLGLSMTMISLGGRLCARKDRRHDPRYCSSL
jgi:hypothetical protein